MAQQTIVVTCPACLTEFEILEFNTQTDLAISEGSVTTRYLRVSLMAQIEHGDCAAIPA